MRLFRSIKELPPVTLYLLLSMLITTVFLFFTLPMGPAITPDSVAYREVALNIMHGHGPVNHQGQLVNHWPPLYPAVLALCALLSGLPLESAALLLQSTLLVLYLLLLFRISGQCQLSPMHRILLIAVACLLPGMFNFSRLMSEGLFNTLLLALVSLGLDYRYKPRPLLMGITAGLLFLTRYAGMAFVAGGGLFILLTEVPDWRQLLRRLVLFGFGPAMAVGGWMLTERLLHAGHFNRVLIFHPIPPHKWIGLSEQINAQMFPPLQGMFPYSGLALLGAFLLISGYWMLSRRGSDLGWQFAFVWISVCAFLLLLFITCFYLDAHTPMDARIWSPVAPLLLLMVFVMLRETGGFLQSAFPLFLLMFNVLPAYALWNKFRSNGEGLSAREWKESPVLQAAAASVQSGKKVYSNGADVLNYYWNADGRFRVYAMPLKYFPTSGTPNASHERAFGTMLSEIKRNQAVLVYFHNIRWRKFLEDSAGLANRLRGKNPESYRDGLILR